MRASLQFARFLQANNLLELTETIRVELFGSLGATGKGHGSDRAIMLGLSGETPELTAPELIQPLIARITAQNQLSLLGKKNITFYEKEHLLFLWEFLPYHPNGMRFSAYDAAKNKIASQVYYSIGGGFIVNEEDINNCNSSQDETAIPYRFRSARQLLEICEQKGLSINQLMLEKKRVGALKQRCDKGCYTSGT
jgi:L-serine dehydratase